jgi:hypothetical protein
MGGYWHSLRLASVGKKGSLCVRYKKANTGSIPLKYGVDVVLGCTTPFLYPLYQDSGEEGFGEHYHNRVRLSSGNLPVCVPG